MRVQIQILEFDEQNKLKINLRQENLCDNLIHTNCNKKTREMFIQS